MRALALVALAGCFGSGGVPTGPAEATEVYGIPIPPDHMSCGQSQYIGSVAFGATRGFFVPMPYQPDNGNCNNGGGGGQSAPVNAMAFDLSSGTMPAAPVGTAGNYGPGVEIPQIVANGDTSTWLFTSASSMSSSLILADTASRMLNLSTQNSAGPAGLAVDPDGTVYIAGYQRQVTLPTFEAPTFPCCGFRISDSPAVMQPVLMTVAPGATSPATSPYGPDYSCDQMKTCVVANTSSLVFVERGTLPTIAKLTQLPKGGATAAVLGELDASTTAATAVPVGFAADDDNVVIAASPDLTQFGVQHACWIYRYDLHAATFALLFSTTSFACQDLAVDASSAYFAIVTVGDQGHMQGVGLGRVALADGTLESIRLGMTGQEAGPRRVYLDADGVYAVDPLVIGKIPKQAFAGRQELGP